VNDKERLGDVSADAGDAAGMLLAHTTAPPNATSRIVEELCMISAKTVKICKIPA